MSASVASRSPCQSGLDTISANTSVAGRDSERRAECLPEHLDAEQAGDVRFREEDPVEALMLRPVRLQGRFLAPRKRETRPGRSRRQVRDAGSARRRTSHGRTGSVQSRRVTTCGAPRSGNHLASPAAATASDVNRLMATWSGCRFDPFGSKVTTTCGRTARMISTSWRRMVSAGADASPRSGYPSTRTVAIPSSAHATISSACRTAPRRSPGTPADLPVLPCSPGVAVHRATRPPLRDRPARESGREHGLVVRMREHEEQASLGGPGHSQCAGAYHGQD